MSKIQNSIPPPIVGGGRGFFFVFFLEWGNEPLSNGVQHASGIHQNVEKKKKTKTQNLPKDDSKRCRCYGNRHLNKLLYNPCHQVSQISCPWIYLQQATLLNLRGAENAVYLKEIAPNPRLICMRQPKLTQKSALKHTIPSKRSKFACSAARKAASTV